jgi:hypothetical protein
MLSPNFDTASAVLASRSPSSAIKLIVPSLAEPIMASPNHTKEPSRDASASKVRRLTTIICNSRHLAKQRENNVTISFLISMRAERNASLK